MRKYEKGLNRIAAGRLFRIAQGLGVEVDFFFEGMSSVAKTSPQQRILLELTRNFIAMTNHRHQEVIYTAVRMLADEAELADQR
jgi:transcriptional regulator with XRE-family HTH domain